MSRPIKSTEIVVCAGLFHETRMHMCSICGGLFVEEVIRPHLENEKTLRTLLDSRK